MIDVAALYVAHEPSVRGYVRRHLVGAGPATIEDLVADVFERAVRAAPGYRDHGAPPEAWLKRIARNLLTDRYRQQGRRASVVRLGDIHPVVTHVGTADHAAQIDARDAVERAMTGLTEAQRAVVVARYFEGMRVREVAGATGHTENGVKKLQDRALVRMRRALEEAA